MRLIATIASYFFILFGLAVLYASTSRTAMQFLSEKRDNDKWWGTYPCKHGDLVSMSYLDFVKTFNPDGPKQYLAKAKDNGIKNTVLVLHGDSYTWHVADSNFFGVSKLYYINRTNGGYYHLDSTRRNIMVIEVSERYIRSYFGGIQIFNEVHDTGTVKKLAFTGVTTNDLAAFLPFSIDDLFNRYINQNLQANLFNYNFIMPVFEGKAALNYYLFNRASGDVVISDDRKFLLLKETISKALPEGSYSPLGQGEVQQIVSVLNAIYEHYKKAGFAEVYFSPIPNPATLLQPEGYNNLIPHIQNSPDLKMKIIDIYSVFKTAPEEYYLHGDTHWNMKGKQLWIDKVNEILSGKRL